MKTIKTSILVLSIAFLGSSCSETQPNRQDFKSNDMMIRIAEIEVDSAYLDEYMAILKEESAASVRLEPGVISLYPMFQKESPTEIRILEIYADKDAYEAH